MQQRYVVQLITPEKKMELYDRYSERYLYQKKANIYGCCIKLLTELEDVKEKWDDNFYTMDENIRSHGRLVVLKEKNGKMDVKYDPYTNTAFLTNIDYYGWIKSIALAVAGDVLEDEHEIYHIHGAAIDVDGVGVSIIAPPGTGKTTHSWGLLRLKGARLVADDWFLSGCLSGDRLRSARRKTATSRRTSGRYGASMRSSSRRCASMRGVGRSSTSGGSSAAAGSYP